MVYDINSAIEKPNVWSAVQQGMQFGQQQRVLREQRADENALRQYGQQIIAGDPGAFQSAAAINPKVAQTYQEAADLPYQRIKGAVALIDSAQDPRQKEAYWQQVRPYLSKITPDGVEPPATFAEAEPHFNALRARIAMIGQDDQQMPTGFRQFQMTAEAAGLKPGTPEYQQAARIALGQEGRASSAGYGFREVVGLDGRKRLQRDNPRKGAVEVYDETTGQFTQVGGAGAPPSAYGGSTQQVPAAQLATINGVPIPPEEMAAYQKALEADARGEAFNIAIPPQGAPTVTTGGAQPVNPALVVSRRPEDEAAAVEAAKTRTQLDYLPQELGMRTDAATQQALAIESGKQGIERDSVARVNQTALRMYEAGMQSLKNSMAKTETGPIVGRLPALTANQQTAEGSVAAMAPILKGLFRQAGEGTFTDRDQELLLAMIPTRTDLPEAREAKLANIDQIVRAKLSAQGGAPARGGQPRRVSSAADYDALPSGATFIDPQGNVRRKR